MDADHPARVGKVVAEGAECVRWLLQSDLQVELVVGKATVLAALGPELAARAGTVTSVVADQAALSALVGFRCTRGVVACGQRPHQPTVDALLGDCVQPRLLVLDAVHDPGNVGGLIRSARCLGVDAVVLGPGCADPFYRRAVRVSVGHVFQLPVVSVPDLGPVFACLEQAGVCILAAHRGPMAAALETIQAPPSWALVLGNEDRGPSPQAVQACHHHVAIPMAPGVDSLNVAVAGAIIMHWLARAERGT